MLSSKSRQEEHYHILIDFRYRGGDYDGSLQRGHRRGAVIGRRRPVRPAARVDDAAEDGNSSGVQKTEMIDRHKRVRLPAELQVDDAAVHVNSSGVGRRGNS